MKKSLLILLVSISACTSSPKKKSAEKMPKDALELEQALTQEPSATLEYLKSRMSATSFGELNVKEPMLTIPSSLYVERTVAAANKEKNEQWGHLRKFRNWSASKRLKHGQSLDENFNCAQVVETQSMGYSLERDFPEVKAMELSVRLHEKVLTCSEYSQNESLFKLSIFAIQRGECAKSNKYLNMFSASSGRTVTDRVTYLRSLCSSGKEVAKGTANRNPWGGYGILLAEPNFEGQRYKWHLGTQSGVEDWDRLLATLVELTENNKQSTVRYIATKINYEKFRALPASFQASVMVLFNYSGADLALFQTLHRFLSDNPDMVSPAVTGLLFPVRYWKEIVENSKSMDPILVKALIRQESAFNPTARSRARASGLMQLIYPTAKRFGVKQPRALLRPEINIQAGSEFLHKLIVEFGSVELALAAYNAGPGVVREWQKRYPTEDINLFVEMIPYAETREYVRLVTRNYKVYQSMLVAPEETKLSLSQNIK